MRLVERAVLMEKKKEDPFINDKNFGTGTKRWSPTREGHLNKIYGMIGGKGKVAAVSTPSSMGPGVIPFNTLRKNAPKAIASKVPKNLHGLYRAPVNQDLAFEKQKIHINLNAPNDGERDKALKAVERNKKLMKGTPIKSHEMGHILDDSKGGHVGRSERLRRMGARGTPGYNVHGKNVFNNKTRKKRFMPAGERFRHSFIPAYERSSLRAEGAANSVVVKQYGGSPKFGNAAATRRRKIIQRQMFSKMRDSVDKMKSAAIDPAKVSAQIGRYRNYRRALRTGNALAHLKLSSIIFRANLMESNVYLRRYL